MRWLTILLSQKQKIIDVVQYQNQDFNFVQHRLDLERKQYNRLFASICHIQFISEKDSKYLIENIYPEMMIYKTSDLNWSQYLAFLVKNYRFNDIRELYVIFNNSRMVFDYYGIPTLPYISLKYGSNSIDFNTLFKYPKFMFHIDYSDLISINYKEYLWFKKNNIYFSPELIKVLLLNPNMEIFNDLIETKETHMDNISVNKYFYENNTDYEKFKIMKSRRLPMELFENVKYLTNLYPFILRYAKENQLSLITAFYNSHNDQMYKSYANLKFFLDNGIITTLREFYIENEINSFNDGPLKLVVYDDYIPSKPFLNKFRLAYQKDLLWPEAKRKILIKYSDPETKKLLERTDYF